MSVYVWLAPHRASGEVLPPDNRRRSFSLRFRAFGKRQVIKLGRPEDGWTMQMAERELAVHRCATSTSEPGGLSRLIRRR